MIDWGRETCGRLDVTESWEWHSPAGSWGPEAADALIQRAGRAWRNPA
ncbi:MAG: hypothetical protein ACREM3_00750 [Candidatus Rokuibacteriota bacterium]